MKLYQKYLVILLLILVGFIAYFYLQNKQNFVNKVHTVLLNILNNKIKDEKSKAFNFAYSLSQNEKLKQAILKKNTTQGYDILKQYMNTLEVLNGTKIHAQIVLTNFVIFARSWDNSDAGINVKVNRPDLQEMKKTLRPHVTFEAARRLVLIASIPIIEANKCIGFVEVIEGFDALEKYFAQYDIDIIALVDDRYKKQTVLLEKNPRIGNMIVANNGANINHIQNIRKLNLTKLKNLGLAENKKYFYFSKVILNSKGNNIGYFILVLSKEKLKLFSSFEKELENFFTYSRKDLYSTIVNKEVSINTYYNLTSKELLSLKKCATKKDKDCIKKQLRKKLQNYTKEELISLLLDVNSKKISRGKIK
ncbi:MAG TPA: hypothetical protein ENK67_03490 [Flavobacteriia bacterium]|nr:hypothetical protein [Flavobacteriia bacterium]